MASAGSGSAIRRIRDATFPNISLGVSSLSYSMIYVALLRGINVGGNRTVSMKTLKAVFEAAGMTDVRTYINSGNVVFSSKLRSPKRIAPLLGKAIAAEFGFAVDVLVVGDRLYYSTFFEQSGFVDLASGKVTRLPKLGPALNEIAPGPGDAVTLTRYGSGGSPSENGSVLWIDGDGALRVEHTLSAPDGLTVAPKTPAWDPTRGHLWLTTDLLAHTPGGPPRRDAYRLDLSGRLLERIASEELHFAAVAPDGALHMAWVRGRELSLRIGGPEAPGLVLDHDFPVELDFVQDIQFASDGRAVLTRWSGVAHVVEPEGSFSTLALPRLDPEGLYYTGALHGERLCVTYCADVSVVCVDAPRKPARSAP